MSSVRKKSRKAVSAKSLEARAVVTHIPKVKFIYLYQRGLGRYLYLIVHTHVHTLQDF